jgi:(p)ppGpp synthase/HD superfamily hydrolase
MATLEKAIELAARYHAGQKDKQGQPYILHPLRLMLRVEGEEARIVAVLHDTLEDTSLTEADLRREGFSESIIQAVLAVTHRAGEPYADYVVRCKALESARRAKLADLEDNSRLDRCILRAGSTGRDFARLHRYFLSYKFLTDALTEQQYRHLMAAEPA